MSPRSLITGLLFACLGAISAPGAIALAAAGSPPGERAGAPGGAPVQVASGDPFQAVLTKAVRKVDWQRYGTKSWQRALLDTVLLGGDTLRTGAESKAELLYGDGSITRVGSLASLTLTGDKRREIRLDGGTIWLNIRKHSAGMRVITPGAVAAVTGTELMVEVDPVRRTTEVTVFEGAVNVTGDVGDLVKVIGGTTTRVPFHAPAAMPVPLGESKLQERSNIFRPLSIESQPSTAPTAPVATTGTVPSTAPSAATATTPPTVPVANPSVAPTTGPVPPPTTEAPPTAQPATSAEQPVKPDLKGQNQQLNDPRLINGSPTTGRVRVIIE